MENLPTALAYGITEEQFWKMNPKRMAPYKEAYILRLKERDEAYWLQGIYFQQALLATVGNMFKSKSAKPHKYPEHPFTSNKLANKSPNKLTEDERKQQVNNLFLSLKVMQSNFNIEHKNERQ